jgi:8-oxo-dGTP pyrophosphatase MutT (NUDIX family)
VPGSTRVVTSPTDASGQPDASAAMLSALRAAMQARPQTTQLLPAGVPRAAVAIILRRGSDGLEVLLIKRAERDGDPWSGHVALPGGREEPDDESLEMTAVRETQEEVNVDLETSAEILGPLDDLHPSSMPLAIVVRPFVAVVKTDQPLTLSDEVAAAFWVPLGMLSAPNAISETVVQIRGVDRRVTAFHHGELVVWGMTERILRQLLTVLGRPHFP